MTDPYRTLGAVAPTPPKDSPIERIRYAWALATVDGDPPHMMHASALRDMLYVLVPSLVELAREQDRAIAALRQRVDDLETGPR